MSTVYTVVTKEGDDSNIGSGFFEQLAIADHIFFLQISDSNVVSNSRYLAKSDLTAHISKRKMNTLFKSMSDENEVDPLTIQRLADSEYSLILGDSIEDSHVKAVAKFLSEDLTVDPNSNIAKFIEGCEKGDGVGGSKIKETTITETREVNTTAASKYDHKVGFDIKSVNEANAKEFIEFISDATEYDGFNPKKVLRKLLGKAETPDEQATIITLILSAYIRIGNNMQKLNSKRKDQQVSRELLQLLQKLGVMRHSKTSDGITLARVAIAMPGELLVMRRVMQKELQVQVEGNLDVVYQDLAFQGVPDINKMTGYEEYAIEFSSLIYRRKNGAPDDIGVSKSDIREWPEFMKSFTRWNNIAKTGYRKNTAASERFAEANTVNMTGDPKGKAFEFFKGSAKHYLKEDEVIV